MARQTQGRIFKRGKKGYYYIQYYLNGKQIVKALRDDNNKPITNKRTAERAAELILAPYKSNNHVQRRQQAIDALRTAEEKALEAERVKSAIKLVNAFEKAMKKARRRPLGEKAKAQKETHWNDFIAYMQAKHPQVRLLNDVQAKHAQNYISYLVNKGKFKKQISYKTKNFSANYKSKMTSLSSRSINCYLTSCRDIFNCLMLDSKLKENPFAEITRIKLEQGERQAFTLEELQLISKNADEFIMPLFTIGLCTGLREADICLLEWKEINFKTGIITRVTRKTKKEVMIPIMPPLKKFLELQYEKSSSNNYVLPVHAEMYKNNPKGISWRVKRFLESLGIKTTEKLEGRSRAISIKDVHSLRHSFCYYAGLYNVPLAIVQAVVGHMSPEMTKHYTMHATSNDIKKAFENMPDMFGVLDIEPEIKRISNTAPERQELYDLLDTLPIEKIRKVLQQLKTER